MLELKLDEDGYPTDESLELIAKHDEITEILPAVKAVWKYPEYWTEEEIDGVKLYWVSTAGWSGNESLIGAMERNFVFWGMYWSAVRRGGHYLFLVEGDGHSWGLPTIEVEIKIARHGAEGAKNA